MSGRIIDMTTGKDVPGEVHFSPKQARRAMLILSAHETKNGRVANFRIEPPVDLMSAESLDLPEWVLAEIYRQHGDDAPKS